jgi:hypothetical protein
LLSLETGVTKPFAQVGIELLLSKPYKFTTVQKRQEADGVDKVRLCNWYCEILYRGEVAAYGRALRMKLLKHVNTQNCEPRLAEIKHTHTQRIKLNYQKLTFGNL